MINDTQQPYRLYTPDREAFEDAAKNYRNMRNALISLVIVLILALFVAGFICGRLNRKLEIAEQSQPVAQQQEALPTEGDASVEWERGAEAGYRAGFLQGIVHASGANWESAFMSSGQHLEPEYKTIIETYYQTWLDSANR